MMGIIPVAVKLESVAMSFVKSDFDKQNRTSTSFHANRDVI